MRAAKLRPVPKPVSPTTKRPCAREGRPALRAGALPARKTWRRLVQAGIAREVHVAEAARHRLAVLPVDERGGFVCGGEHGRRWYRGPERYPDCRDKRHARGRGRAGGARLRRRPGVSSPPIRTPRSRGGSKMATKSRAYSAEGHRDPRGSLADPAPAGDVHRPGQPEPRAGRGHRQRGRRGPRRVREEASR